MNSVRLIYQITCLLLCSKEVCPSNLHIMSWWIIGFDYTCSVRVLLFNWSISLGVYFYMNRHQSIVLIYSPSCSDLGNLSISIWSSISGLCRMFIWEEKKEGGTKTILHLKIKSRARIRNKCFEWQSVHWSWSSVYFSFNPLLVTLRL